MCSNTEDNVIQNVELVSSYYLDCISFWTYSKEMIDKWGWIIQSIVYVNF